MQHPETQRDHLQPEMPRIPGVNDGATKTAHSPKPLQAIVLIASALILGGIAFRILRVPRSNASSAADQRDAQPISPAVPAPATSAEAPSGPKGVATVEQLSASWSSQKFTFLNPVTDEEVPAMVIHIPGASASRAAAYWAFSLNAPYQNCQLAFITNPKEISAKYGYRASHPMVVNPCDDTVYDPLQVASIPSGAWVRGEVVQGPGIRPPVAIDIRIEGHSVIADGIE